MECGPIMRACWIGLGSNLPDRSDNLTDAINRLKQVTGIVVVAHSAFYEFDSEYCSQKSVFLNGVVKVETALSPIEILDALESIEMAMGRGKKGNNSDRPIDLDILTIADEITVTPRLIVPHPLIPIRKFVLGPLAALSPEWRHPILGCSAAELRDRLVAVSPPAGVISA